MQEKKSSVRKILIIQYIIFLAVYCGLDIFLGIYEMEYRTWFKVIALSYLWLFPVIGIGYLMFEWREHKKEERIIARLKNGITEDRAFQWGTGLLFLAYELGMILLSLFMCGLMIFTVGSEKRLDNGIIEVQGFLGGPSSYYETVAFFFKKEIEIPQNTQADTEIDQEYPSPQDAETLENAEQEEHNIERIKHPDKKQSFIEESQKKKENARYLNVYEEDRPLADAVWLIYEKHYIDNPNSESEAPYFTYNAKGNFYAEVMQKDHSRVLLVYNGMSENGKCQLFVAEEEHYDTDGNQLDNTSLLEFYAVNLEEGQVYEAHKTTWGGAESEEYKKATRE